MNTPYHQILRDAAGIIERQFFKSINLYSLYEDCYSVLQKYNEEPMNEFAAAVLLAIFVESERLAKRQ